ncbi:MAG: tetratricopeptide repeat protein [Bacteroidales bacterium]|jgi:tetratricopeptide (TPR) repeat protein|nr:tetratricopeptide repeat protein [Bacteroidales bacterium]
MQPVPFKISTNTLSVAVILILLNLSVMPLSAQADKKFIRQGNRQYEKEKFSDSEILYRKAIDKNKGSADAVFNTGDALYKQKKYEDAGRQFSENHKMYEDKDKKSASLYNLGNSLLMANKLKESIEAYKSSLRIKPDDPEAKYNLAYAQDLLRKQEEQQQQQQQQQNKNDQNRDQNKKDDQKKDQNNNNQQQDQQQQDQQDKQQDPQAISKEDAERLLNAIANDEKNVQEKVKLAKAAKEKVNTIKNW